MEATLCAVLSSDPLVAGDSRSDIRGSGRRQTGVLDAKSRAAGGRCGDGLDGGDAMVHGTDGGSLGGREGGRGVRGLSGETERLDATG